MVTNTNMICMVNIAFLSATIHSFNKLTTNTLFNTVELLWFIITISCNTDLIIRKIISLLGQTQLTTLLHTTINTQIKFSYFKINN